MVQLTQEEFPISVSNTFATSANSVASSAITGRTFFITGWDYFVQGGTALTTINVVNLQGLSSGVTTSLGYGLPATASGASLLKSYTSPGLPGTVGGSVAVTVTGNTTATTCALNLYGYYI